LARQLAGTDYSLDSAIRFFDSAIAFCDLLTIRLLLSI
jgi:hypothetical protein